MATGTKLHLEEQLCFALYAATNAITRVYRPLLQALGLTYPQYLVLMVLWEQGPQPMGMIARRLGLYPNAVTPLVIRLEKAHLVRRRVSRRDLRSSIACLTKKGIELQRAASRVQRTVTCRTELQSRQFAALREQLYELTTALQKKSEVELQH